jgi:predicted alpha-1,2-mannosidase
VTLAHPSHISLGLVAWLLAVGCSADDVPALDPPVPLHSTYDLVDPFIGTGGNGVRSPNCFPGAVAPFGLVQVSPDTETESGLATWYNHAGGYHYEDTHIIGFSHNRLQGTSTPDMGAVLVMPVAGGEIGDLAVPDGYRSGFDKASEVARPGFYGVTLDAGIGVELTAAARSASHRYRFPAGDARVVVDLSHAMTDVEVIDAELHVLADEQALQGFTRHCGRESCDSGGGLHTYFYLRFSAPFEPWFTWEDGPPEQGVADRGGPEIGAVLGFAPSDSVELEVQVGLSYVDDEGARANLDDDQGGGGFDETEQAVAAWWRDELTSIRVGGGTVDQQRIMATALYHNYVVPNLFGDADGSYRGFDGEVHVAEGFDYHANFSMWDTYRTTHPLLDLVEPDRQREMVLSLMAVADQGGYLPRWPMGHGYTNSTVGSPADVVLADAALKGIDGVDWDRAYEMMLRTAFEPPTAGHPFSGREGIESYVALGYVPADEQQRSVSQTLEFAIADGAIAALARQLGRDDDAALFEQRAGSYRNLWDPEIAAFTGRNADGSWVEIDPLAYEPEGLFYGGNALQHSWLAPHDMAGLVEIHGSEDLLAERLEDLFEQSVTEQENLTDISVLVPSTYYYHGNEPGIHAPYLFLAVGRPDLAQRWIDWASATFYQATPDGIAGNEDAGALSAWYVLSSLGLYPVPASDIYLIGRPLFPVAEVAVAGGTLRIEAAGADAGMSYVHGVTLNGVDLSHPWLRHDEITAGGALVFTMGEGPGDWGTNFGEP